LEKPIIFLQEPESNRWWFEIGTNSGDVTHIACSQEEYKKATENEIPDRWLKFIQKIEGFSK
jgi:hypothetical protein